MGRPREFDIDKAITTAGELFWRKGYEGTSLNDLTSAMRITAPSFYFAFGNKEKLFRKVIEGYYSSQIHLFNAAVREPTVRAVAEKFLHGYVDILTDPAHAPGCLALNSALPCTEGDTVRVWLANLRKEFTRKLRDRFAEACGTSELPIDADPEALARVVVTMAWGLAVEAQSGAKRKDLHRTITTALAAWPGATTPVPENVPTPRGRKSVIARRRL